MTRSVSGTRRPGRKALLGAIVCLGLLIAGAVAVSGILQSSGPYSGEAVRRMKDNIMLGLLILGILGTFGVITYYYMTIDPASRR